MTRRIVARAVDGAGRATRVARLAAAVLLVLVVGCGEDMERLAPEASPKSEASRDATSTTQVEARRPGPRETTPAFRPATERPAVVTATRVTTGASAVAAQGPQPGPRPQGQVAEPPVSAEHSTWDIEERHVCRPGEAFGRWAWQDFVGWSPDGATILFSRGAELYGVTAEGTRIWPVADAGTSTVLGEAGTTIPFAVSPDGTRVVFATCRYGKPNPAIPSTNREMPPTRVVRLGYELASVNVDGTDPRRLTTNALEFDSFPAWAPDGRRIAHLYARHGQGGAFRLKVTPLDGGQTLDATRLVKPGFRQEVLLAPQPPAWSPDGRQLAVRGVAGAVYLVDADDGWARQIAPHSQITTNVVGGPAWSPDGTRLAVLNVIDGDFALMTFDLDLRDVQWLATLAGRGGAGARQSWAPTVAWSPDGSRILALPQPGSKGRAGYLAEGSHDAYMVTVTGVARGQVTPIPARGHYAYAAAWAPDGSRVVVASMWDFSQNDRRWGAEDPTRWGDVWIRTVTTKGRVLGIVAVRDNDGRLEPWNATRAYDQDLLDACRIGGAVADAETNPGLADDCAALLALWARSDESEYANWSVERPLSTWDGVAVGGTPPRVRELRLADGGLRGSDARALRWLTELRRLEVSEFRLGFIPRELGQLEHLEELRLAGSCVCLRIPAELGQLANLRILDLSRNEMTRPIPPELGQLAALTHLDLSGNQLTGPIPAELGRLTNLEFLDLSQNQLTGAIPVELGQLDGLREVRLAGNALTGCVPSGFPVVDREALGLPDCEAGV